MEYAVDFSTTNTEVLDEAINVANSNPINLAHDTLYNKTGKFVEIWTGAGKTGTQLTDTTDYTIGDAVPDADLPASISPDVAYSTVSITNATYHSTALYVSYFPLGDIINASRWNDLIDALGMPPGLVIPYSGALLPTDTLWLKKEAEAISQTTYSGLFVSAFNSVDWFAPDLASAGTAAGANNFYKPGATDLYVRGSAIHGTATFTNGTDSLTITDVTGDTVNDDIRNGTPIRFIDGTMPTGITEYVTYYLYWNTSLWELYTTEDGAVDGSGTQVTFTTDGSGVTATQFGITLNDAMQQITASYQAYGDSNNDASRNALASGALKQGSIASSGRGASIASALTSPMLFDSSLSTSPAIAKTSPNENRGRQTYMKYIITT